MHFDSSISHELRRLALFTLKVKYAAIVLWVVGAVVVPAQTFTNLYSFQFRPVGGLSQAANGDLYGTTNAGSTNGTIFKITLGGTLTTLYNFCSQGGDECTDGEFPDAALVQATNGDFYGTTLYGGGPNDEGTVFKVTPDGKLTTLYTFCLQDGCPDGSQPHAALVQGSDGDLYGTTYGDIFDNPVGTVFKITPGGTFTTLYTFCSQSGCADGNECEGSLVEGTEGDFYGTTSAGGANGYGTVFRITSAGTLTTLYNFCSQSACTDGASPEAGLVLARNGELYGTTVFGGSANAGTAFAITPKGTFKSLYSFCSQAGCLDGQHPLAGLLQATDGNFYGTTSSAGSNMYGTIFQLTPSGEIATLYSFCSESGCADGGSPEGDLLQDTNGILYGTTAVNTLGNGINGTFFSLSLGLDPFVETRPPSGKAGAIIRILGTDLTESTSVRFAGTATTFKVVSGSEIAAAVPAGALSGRVKVVTPGGTLTSNVSFGVLP